MDRRVFLAAVAAVAAGCRGGSQDDAAPTSLPGSNTTQTTGSATTASDPTATTNPSTTETFVEPLTAPAADLDDGAFNLGVASGDPSVDGAVIWTSLTAPSGRPSEATPFVWEVAADPTMEQLIATDIATTNEAGVHQIVVAGLKPATSYWYRFRSGDQISPVGRFKTLPAPGTTAGTFRIGFSSCQHRGSAAWAAHRDMAEADLDLVIWLGDYIYEGPIVQTNSDTTTDQGTSDIPAGEAITLEDYRDRYRRYRSDPLLQASHGAAAWLTGTDDHEVVNDFDASVDPARRLAALQAWREFIPSRVGTPNEEGLALYRSIRFGDLGACALVDVRQFADGNTLLGADQLDWLKGELASFGGWKLLASPVLFGGLLGPDGPDAPLLGYSWDGYGDERAEIARLLDGGVVLSGDLHTSMVLDVRANPEFTDEPVVATEFMAPAISSQFPARLAPALPFAGLLNPQLREIDPSNGWIMVELNEQTVTVTRRVVTEPTDPTSAVRTESTWTLDRDGTLARL